MGASRCELMAAMALAEAQTSEIHTVDVERTVPETKAMGRLNRRRPSHIGSDMDQAPGFVVQKQRKPPTKQGVLKGIGRPGGTRTPNQSVMSARL